MTQINPFTGSIVQAPQVQRQLAAEKDRHLRRVADQAKNAALQDDQLEHQVESSDAVAAVHPDDRHPQGGKRKAPKRDDDRDDARPDGESGDPHLDLKA